MRARKLLCLIIGLACLAAWMPIRLVQAAPATYFVSSLSGADSNNGLSSATAFATIAKVNGLNLQPGDRVLFKCGDTWHAEQLVLIKSGTAGAQIIFGSYPDAACANQPAISGSRAIGGWVLDSGSVYKANLAAGLFPNGINQLFRAGTRLTLGRWPNLTDANAGYAFIEGHSSGSSQITDNQLPAGDWTGAVAHIKNIRWSMIDRLVTGSSGKTLSFNTGLSCLYSDTPDCVGWGYFLNNHRATLDQDGEWFYDAAARQVLLYSSSGMPSNIEGSVVLETGESPRQGGVMLSDGSATAYVTLDNLAIINWFNHGIGTPGGMNAGIYHHLTVRNVTIRDVDGAGVNLSSWLQQPPDGILGLRGGHHLLFANNLIDGANSFGITGYFAESVFEDNTIRNIALVKNLGKAGMACGTTVGECTENGDGFRIRTHMPENSGFGNLLRYNTFQKIGYNGVDVFGAETTLERNIFDETCTTKADCGAVRTFGDGDLASTPVYNLHLVENIIANIPGNVDGCEGSRAPFGFGLYVDNYSRDVEVRGNTIINTTAAGILYQRSSGTITDNTVFNASSGTAYSAQIDLGGSETRASMSGNVMYGLTANAWTLYAESLSNILSSDWNYFFHPYEDQHIAHGPGWARETFAGWKAYSGRDANSKTNWFTQAAGEESRGVIFYNKGKTSLTVDLADRQYLDLNQQVVMGSLILAPFTSRVLVDNGAAQLSLKSISPLLAAAGAAQDFDLLVEGSGFTANSVVQWQGADRPTTFISSFRLSAAISAADVSAIGLYAVTVRDPAPAPGGSESTAVMFHVVDTVYKVFLPRIAR